MLREAKRLHDQEGLIGCFDTRRKRLSLSGRNTATAFRAKTTSVSSKPDGFPLKYTRDTNCAVRMVASVGAGVGALAIPKSV